MDEALPSLRQRLTSWCDALDGHMPTGILCSWAQSGCEWLSQRVWKLRQGAKLRSGQGTQEGLQRREEGQSCMGICAFMFTHGCV